MKNLIPYSHQHIDQGDIEAVSKVLQSEYITQGPAISKFEKALCNYTGAKNAVVVSSGTAGLHLACIAAGIKSGDQAITSPLTFVASANCVLYCGGKVIFADVEKGTANIIPQEIEKKVNNRTKVVIPVHFAGQPCDMESIFRLKTKYNLIVIEDAAHALGARFRNAKIGSCRYSDMTVLSFHPVKSITTGEGGAVLTNNKRLYDKLVTLRAHGIVKNKQLSRKKGGWYYEMKMLGYNYRMTDIQAALGLSQMKKLNDFIMKRKKIYSLYNSSFKDNPFFNVMEQEPNCFSAHHLYPILLKDKYKFKKNIIFKKMREAGLGVQVHYIPVYLHPYYQRLGYKNLVCANAEDFYQREISLPIYPDMNLRQVSKVINTIFRLFEVA